MRELEDKIVHLLEKRQHSISMSMLQKELKIKDKKKKALVQALESLKSDGRISVTKDGRIRLPKKKEPTQEAVIVSLSRGFAFARPADGGEDIFIHADRLQSAFIGDRVSLCHIRQSPKGPSADVGSILKKGSRFVTGTLAEQNGVLELHPDVAIRYNIPVSRKNVAEEKPGSKVQARIRRKAHSSEMQAEIVKAYGPAGSARVCTDAILDQNGIHIEFPPEALAEAEAAASQKITEADLKGRLDLRNLSICTIDGADAKDLDDAISVSRTRKGYRLGVHIADVSHYVAENGALDQEAKSRGTSVYFADRVVPMLPEALSNGSCSLNAGEDKLTFSAIIELDKEANILSYKFRKSIIRSRVRGVYSEVNSLFDGTADHDLRKKYSPVIRSLHAAKDLAGILKEQFARNGAVDLDSTESEFLLNDEGVCIGIRPRKSGEAEQMIEYLMITANRAAAMFAESAGIPFVYRVHEQPNPDRVAALIQVVDAAGLDSRPLKHRDGKVSPKDFSNILKQASGNSAQKVISHQLLRSMAKARYDVNPLGHFGLALSDYCHFTSPIRRYPDTAIHRILSALVKKKKAGDLKDRYSDFAGEAAKLSSEAEVRAMAAERSADDCYMAEYMSQHIGDVCRGVISGVTQRGVFVELENTAEGFVPMDSVPGDFRFDGKLSQVDAKTGNRLTIGRPMQIRVVSADVASGRIDFAYEGPAE